MAASYVATPAKGAHRCENICAELEACVAFTIDHDKNCHITSKCVHQTHDHTLPYSTFIKDEVNDFTTKVGKGGAHTAGNAGQTKRGRHGAENCDYCPPQNVCEEPRLCRLGRCFRGLPLKDGTLCDDGDPDTRGESCQNGRCLGRPVQP